MSVARLPDFDATELVAYEPWKQPWWKFTRGDGPTLAWMLLIHAGAVIGLVLAPAPGWTVGAGAALLHFVGSLGMTVGYHRAIAHKSLKLHPAAQWVLTFFAMFNGAGSPLSWAAYHRLHHAKGDTREDVSSPRWGGFWWAHLRWLWQAGFAPIGRYGRDLDTPGNRRWARVQIPVLALSLLVGLPFGWKAMLWLGPVRLVFALHAQCFTNSVSHLRPDAGPQEGTARNVAWLSLMHFFAGENWHQNHHDRPGSARLGWSPAQLDTGWYLIVLLEKLGLATDVRRPAVEQQSLDAAA
ncbi:MAG TPA: fatty acid desaturase [Polyangia bacterium]|nr:fatty acid desaturase [Polyangia bacterium]